MALPRNQSKSHTSPRRPVSYHPSSSYQSSTSPRNRTESSNYFASAAFKSHGWPSIGETTSTQASSYAKIDRALAAVSSESETSDDDEAAPPERDLSECNQRNGYSESSLAANTNTERQIDAALSNVADTCLNSVADASTSSVADASVSSVADASTSGVTDASVSSVTDDSTSSVADASTSIVAEESEASRDVVHLLKFKDDGVSLQEFIEQQNLSSAQTSEASESEEDEEESSVSVVEDSSNRPSSTESYEEDASRRATSAEPVEEMSATRAISSEAVVEDASTQASSTKTAIDDQETEEDTAGVLDRVADSNSDITGEEESNASSELSGGVDDGVDATEQGYVEIEPGIIDDGDTDSGSVYSDPDDDIFVGRSLEAEDRFSGQGDLLTECLDMLSGAGYLDLQAEQDNDRTLNAETAAASLLSDHEEERLADVDDSQSFDEGDSTGIEMAASGNESQSEEATESSTETVDDAEAGIVCDASASLVDSSLDMPDTEQNTDSGLLSGQEIDCEGQPASIGNVLSVLEDITMHTELMTKPRSGHTVATRTEESTLRPELSAAEEGFSTHDNNEHAGNSSRMQRVNKLKNTDVDKDGHNRNRSFNKAILGLSFEGNSKEKLTNRKSSPGSLWSKKPEFVLGHPSDEAATSKIEGDVKKDETEGVDSLSWFSEGIEASSSFLESPGVALASSNASSAEISMIDNSDLSTEIISSHERTTSDSDTSLFSARHRILRQPDSMFSNSTENSPNSIPSNPHKISNRTDVVGPNVSLTNSGTKLRYSVSDPLSKNKVKKADSAKIPTDTLQNFKLSDTLDLNSLIFRTDLRESSVDGPNASMNSLVAAANRRKELKPDENGIQSIAMASNAINFDTTALKDNATSIRETAILSSNEDIPYSSSKNRPIGRTDQPLALEEITLSSSAPSFENERQLPLRRSLKDTPWQRTEPKLPTREVMAIEINQPPQGLQFNDKNASARATSYADSFIAPQAPKKPSANELGDLRVPSDLESQPKGKGGVNKPPPLPPREPDVERKIEEAKKSRTTPEEKPVADPWLNVTKRRPRPPKTTIEAAPAFADLDATSRVLDSIVQTIAKGVLPVVQQDLSVAPRDSSIVQRDSAAVPRDSVIEPLDSSVVSRDSSAAPRDSPFVPKKQDRARAIQRTTATPSNGIGRPTEARARGIAETHELPTRRPEQPKAPGAADRRITTHAEASATSSHKGSTRPPVVPPRTDKQRPVVQAKTPWQNASAQPEAPSKKKATSTNSAPTTSSQTADVVRKRTNKDVVSRERREEPGANSAWVSSNSQRSQGSLRSPAIIHADAQTRENSVPLDPTRNPEIRVDENGDPLPSREF